MEPPPKYTPYPTNPQLQQPQSTTSYQYAPTTTQVTGQPIPPPPMPQPEYAAYPSSPPPQAGYTIATTCPGGQPTIGVGAPTPQVVSRTVVVQQPVSIYGRSPIQCVCPNCHQNVITTTNIEPGIYTWLMCLVLCFFVGLFGLIPFCVPDCQDVRHTCPNCHYTVHVNKKI